MPLLPTQNVALKQLLTEVLTVVKPDELILVQGVVDAKSPDRAVDGALGFGGGPEIHLVLPVLLDCAKALCSAAAIDIAKIWGKELASWAAGKRDSSIDPSALQKFGRRVQERLTERGFAAAEAAQISDCMITTLVSQPRLLADLIKK